MDIMQATAIFEIMIFLLVMTIVLLGIGLFILWRRKQERRLMSRLYNVSLPQSKKVAASKKLESESLSLALFDLAKTFIQIENKGIYRIKAMHQKAVRSNIENSVQKIIYGNPSKSDFEQIWDEEIKRERSFISHLEHLEKILKSASWKSNRLEQAKSTLVETDRRLWDVYTGNVDTVNKIAQLKAAKSSG